MAACTEGNSQVYSAPCVKSESLRSSVDLHVRLKPVMLNKTEALCFNQYNATRQPTGSPGGAACFGFA